jgi:transmembrane sensor
MTVPLERSSPSASHLLDEAAQWLARKHSSNFTQADQAKLDQWRGQSEAHRKIWAQAQLLADKFGMLPPTMGMAVLDRQRMQVRNRRALLSVVAGLTGLSTSVWLGLQLEPWWQSGMADYRTAIGEQRKVHLADGSVVLLNTGTAISVKFDATRRLIVLHEGEILVDSAPDPQPVYRPLFVKTAQGLMQALGTRFVVRTTGQHTKLSVLEGAVQISPALLTASPVVKAGEAMEFSRQSIGALSPSSAHVAAWEQGFIYADAMRLDVLIAELSRYRSGVLRCEPDIAALKVSGVFQIEDTDKVLQLLATTLPIKVQMRTAYWVLVSGKT